jgi:hypothetical protein
MKNLTNQNVGHLGIPRKVLGRLLLKMGQTQEKWDEWEPYIEL